MKKTNISLFLIVTVVLIVLGLGYYFMSMRAANDIIPSGIAKASDVKNIDYVILGETFRLINGVASKEASLGSASNQTVRIFGEPVYGDLNNDGNTMDAAIMLTSDSGGSGTFYYAVLAIASSSSYISTNTLLLGDRIAPQTVEIRDGRALYNYAERKAGEPMTAQPSIGKSLWIHFDKKTGEIGELVQNFEGEADPSKMTLGMKKWEWVKTQMNDGKVITPNKAGVFTIVFNKDGTVNMETDCNRMFGSYIVQDTTLTFTKMGSTKMYCSGSQEQEFAQAINNIGSFLFTSKGELILEIKMDSGTIVFR